MLVFRTRDMILLNIQGESRLDSRVRRKGCQLVYGMSMEMSATNLSLEIVELLCPGIVRAFDDGEKPLRTLKEDLLHLSVWLVLRL